MVSPENAGWRLGAGTLLQGLNSSMIAVAGTSIGTDFHDYTAIPWLVSALYFTAAISSPMFGHLSDRYGAKKIYDIGLLITFIASCIGPFCSNIWMLVIIRALLGVGTSAQMPTAVALVVYLSKIQRTNSSRGIGTISMLGQVSAAVGPVLGGIIVSVLGWKWIFWFNIPLIINAFCLTRIISSVQPRIKNGNSLDLMGIFLFSTGIIAILYGLLGTNIWRICMGLGIGVLISILLYYHEEKSHNPFVDLQFLKFHPTIIYIYLRTVVVNIAFYTIFYGIPQWAEQDASMNAFHAGMLLLPNFAAGVAATRFASNHTGTFSPKCMRIAGSILVICSAGITGITFGGGINKLFYLAMFFLGLPSGFNNMGNQLELNRCVEQNQLGQATGVFRTSQFIGAAISTPIVFHVLNTFNVNRIAGSRAVGHVEVLMLVIVIAGILTLLLDLMHEYIWVVKNEKTRNV